MFAALREGIIKPTMPKRILIVDDAQFMRNFIKDILTKGGYEICGEAPNALEGLSKYKELKPDMATMDIIMPKMEEIDGIAAVKEIMAFDASAKIIIVSALAEKKLIQQALIYGAKDFISKPFTAEKLLSICRKILGE